MYYWRAGANSLKRRFFVRRAIAHALILRASRYTSLNITETDRERRTRETAEKRLVWTAS